MAHLGEVKLGNNLTFTCNTHTPSTGAAVDADAVPGYRVYEDETAGPLLTGSMALLDDANTTGFYSEQIAVTSGNGFEAAKDYSIRITGVVGGVTGVEIHNFRVTANYTDDVKTDTAAILLDTGTDGVVVGNHTAAAKAELQVEATDALNAYDPPTYAEMEARTLAAAAYFDPAVDAIASVGTVTTVSGNVNGSVNSVVTTVGGNVLGNVVGSVGSVTGDVGGNVTGSVGSVGAGGIAATAFAADALSAAAVSAAAVTKMQAGLALDATVAKAATALSTATWTNARAGYLDNLAAGGVALDSTVAKAATALSNATWTDARAGYLDNLSAGAVALDSTVAKAATALSTGTWTAARAGYLDNLSGGAVALDSTVAKAATALSTAQWSNTRAGYLDNLSAGAVALEATAQSILTDTGTTLDNLVDDLESRLTATRAGYLDNLSAGAVAQQSTLTGLNNLSSADAQTAAAAAITAAGVLTTGDLTTLNANVASILADTGTDGVVVAAASKTGYALSTAGVDAVLDEVVKGTFTMRQILSYLLASLSKVSGGGTETITFRHGDDSGDAMVATVTTAGNRTAVTFTP